ncbi:MAG: ribosomal RNA small subunit methyltransferase I [Rhizomicrobium sp.]
MARKAWQAPGRTAKAATSDKSDGKSTGSAAQGKPSDGESVVDGESALPLLPPALYIVATPIGHARDITLRALDVLKSVDLIAAEDTRVTAKLLAIYDIRKPLIPYNDHSSDRDRARLLEKVKGGARVAQVSDAGMPLVSDPGFKLVREALAEGVAVECIPGASASLTALTLSGQPSDRFVFAGFLPAKAGERKTVL